MTPMPLPYETHVGPESFAGSLSALCEEHVEEADRRAYTAVHKGALETRRQLVSTSPHLTGEYAAGWQVRNRRAAGTAECCVVQMKKPSLTWLLETGHGGPHPAPAKPHIQPAYQTGREAMLNELG